MLKKINSQALVEATLAMVVSLSLAGCATVQPVSAVDPASALNGRGLDAAVNLYGPYNGRLALAGRTAYVWRRSILVGGRPRACELRAEAAFHDLIRATRLEGDPNACQAFWVRYTNNAQTRDAADDPEAAAGKTVAQGSATGGRNANWRPVGAPAAMETAAQGR